MSLTGICTIFSQYLCYGVDTAENQETSCSILPERAQVKYQYSSSNLGNKYAKYTYGNRKQAGIRIFHLNKGNSHLKNKIPEIESIISNYHPHVLGLSEGNFFENQELEAVQIKDYSLINAKSLHNPDCRII